MMKIVAGLGDVEAFEAYVQAGADELFCGCMPFEWLDRYGVVSPLNRREVLLYPVQIASMTDMRILARLSERDHVPVAVTMNSTCYAPVQYPLIAHMVRELADMGFERFILADPALMLHLRLSGSTVKFHLSGEFGQFSRASLKAVEEFGISRYIFPRKTDPDEMAACIGEWPDREYEAFVLNERCYYTGAMCHSLHCDEMPHLCRIPWRMGGVETPVSFPEASDRDTDADALGASGCGLCALSALERAGVTHLKLVGRGNLRERMVRDISALKRALSESERPEAIRAALFPNGCPGTCYYGDNHEYT